MASFTHFYFFSLGKVTPGLTQRISLVCVSADNTRTAQHRKNVTLYSNNVLEERPKKKKNCTGLMCIYSTPSLNEFIMLLDYTP